MCRVAGEEAEAPRLLAPPQATMAEQPIAPGAMPDPKEQRRRSGPSWRLDGPAQSDASARSDGPGRSSGRRGDGPRDVTQQLPPDLLEMVLARLADGRSRNAASLVCARWREAERATRRLLELRGCLQDLPSLSQGPLPLPVVLSQHQGTHSPVEGRMLRADAAHVGFPQGPASRIQERHRKAEVTAREGGAAHGPPLSLGCSIEALDLSLLWPWGETLLLAAQPARQGAQSASPARQGAQSVNTARQGAQSVNTARQGGPAAAPPPSRALSQSLATERGGRAASTESRAATRLSGAAEAAPSADAKSGAEAPAVPVARLDASGAQEPGATLTEQIVPQLAGSPVYPEEATSPAPAGVCHPCAPSATAQGALGAATPHLASIPLPTGFRNSTRDTLGNGPRDISAPASRTSGLCGPADASASEPVKQVQSVLRTAFPRVRALRVYLQSDRDVRLMAGTWEAHQIRHLAPVRLALCLAERRQHRGGGGTATNGAAGAAQGTDGVGTAPGRGEEEGGEGALDMSGLTQLLRAYPGLTTLDLSQFLCMPEDIPRALTLAPAPAQGLKVLNLLSIGARGLKGSELAAVAGACPRLRSLRCAGEFDARLEDPVGDAALAHLARACPRLAHLHLAHTSLVPHPLLEQRAFCAAAPRGLESAEGGDGEDATASSAGPGRLEGASISKGRSSTSVSDVPRAGTQIPFDWPRLSALGPECVAEVEPCAAAAAAGGDQDPAAAPGTPVAVSTSGLRTALALLPSLVHLGLLLPGPPRASLSLAEEGALPAAAPGGEGGWEDRGEGGEGRRGGEGRGGAGAGRGGGIAGSDPSSTGGTGATTDWGLLDLSSLCPALTSLHLCPLGTPLPATAPLPAAALLRGASPSQSPVLPLLLPPSLLQLHLRAAAISQGGAPAPSVSAEPDEGDHSALHPSPVSIPPLSGRDLCLEIASAWPRLRSLELWGCHGMHRGPLQAALRSLAPSLRHLSVLHCQPLSTPDLLSALEPLRPSLLSLEISLCPGELPFEPCATTSVAPGASLPTGPASSSTQWTVASPVVGGGLAGEGLEGPDALSGMGWAQLQRLSLWLPLGVPLGGFIPRLLGPACPLLHTVSISVAGDCRGIPGPGVGDFGLASLAAYRGLTTVLLNLSGVSGYSLSCPAGSGDIDTWERFHLAGIEAQGGCAAVHLWPPRDCDTQRRALSLAAASLLALCPALRGLAVHGTASEHALAQLLPAPQLRDVRLIPDCHLGGLAAGGGGMAHFSLSKVRRASLCRFHSSLVDKGYPD